MWFSDSNQLRLRLPVLQLWRPNWNVCSIATSAFACRYCFIILRGYLTCGIILISWQLTGFFGFWRMSLFLLSGLLGNLSSGWLWLACLRFCAALCLRVRFFLMHRIIYSVLDSFEFPHCHGVLTATIESISRCLYLFSNHFRSGFIGNLCHFSRFSFWVRHLWF